MLGSSGSPRRRGAEARPRQARALRLLGLALLGLWAAWWADALVHSELRWAARTWIRIPAFGVDFWTQPDWAVRLWDLGTSPYVEDHMFHYPPIVIHLFRWVLWFDSATALRVWWAVLTLVTALGTWVAWRARSGLGLGRPPLPLVLAAVLFSYPALFALERANFDLITLAAILVAVSVARPGSPGREVVAGAMLSFGPWVKIYPGLLGLSLVALRWWRGMIGFALGGVVIGLLEPTELVKSLRLIRRLIGYHSELEASGPKVFWTWSHSLSMLVRKLFTLGGDLVPAPIAERFPMSLGALVLLAPLLIWVTVRTFRCRAPALLAFPLMCWFVAAASFVPEVANDYSLVFLPLAAVGAWSRRDGWAVQLAYGVGLVAMQPVSLPIDGFVFLGMKVVMLGAVAASLVGRAREIERDPAGRPSPVAVTL